MTKTIAFSALILSLTISASVSADPADVNLTKSNLNVDFNKMIDEGSRAKSNIQKNIDEKLNADIDEVSDKSKVLDFVDVEVGWGETPSPVVDRRFDSVGAPILIDLSRLVPNFKGS